jgi:thiamine biosynthesis protein ThiC
MVGVACKSAREPRDLRMAKSRVELDWEGQFLTRQFLNIMS